VKGLVFQLDTWGRAKDAISNRFCILASIIRITYIDNKSLKCEAGLGAGAKAPRDSEEYHENGEDYWN
jgi:hypothetical protein